MRKLLSVLLVSLLIIPVGCQKKGRLKADAIEDRAEFPLMDSHDVVTLVSDSGVTRYRIQAPVWRKYDQSNPPKEEFPEGICLEKFNEDLAIEATLKADYAVYDEDADRWELNGNVYAVNEAGEQFETEQLIWEQQTEQIHTDSAITITKATSVIMGIGMISNQNMSKYTILKPTGYFPIEEE